METIKKLKADDWQGTVDVNLEISLFEYGLIHKHEPDGSISFIFGVALNPDCSESNKFRYANFSKSEVMESIDELFGFADLQDVAETNGQPLESWNTKPFEQKIVDLYFYYGYQNIFGHSMQAPFTVKGE